MTPEVTVEKLTQRIHWQTFEIKSCHPSLAPDATIKTMVRFSSGAADGLPIDSILEQWCAGAGWGLNRAALSGFPYQLPFVRI